MKTETIFAIVLSLVVIAVSSLLILVLEPSNKTVPYFHDKTVEEVDSFLLALKEEKTDELIFKDLMNIDSDTLKYVIGIEPEYLEGYSVKTSTENATSFLVLRLKEGSKSLIETSVIEYMDYLEKKWETVDKDQATLVQNYTKVALGDYLIYIISPDNEYVKENLNSLFIYTDK